MNFYLDFEATQFTGKIISIGCTLESGKNFYTLVRSGNKMTSVTKFITQLTGITREMLLEAPYADEAFRSFYEFYKDDFEENDRFIFYGTADKDFLSNTICQMEDKNSIEIANYIRLNYVDGSKNIARYFGTQMVALKKVVGYFRGEEIVQKHNAMEDALMLKEAIDNVNSSPLLLDSPFKSNQKQNQKSCRIRNTIAVLARKEALREDRRKNATIKAIDVHGGKELYFTSYTEAYDVFNPTQVNKTTKSRIYKKIKEATESNIRYGNYIWSKVNNKEEE